MLLFYFIWIKGWAGTFIPLIKYNINGYCLKNLSTIDYCSIWYIKKTIHEVLSMEIIVCLKTS